jgi:uncharacterized protein (TIGR03437 family)
MPLHPATNTGTTPLEPGPDSIVRTGTLRSKRKRFAQKALALLLCVGSVLTAIPQNLLAQQAPVNLGSAGNYVILTKTGITDVPPSAIVGNIGSSPITGAAIHITCAEVTGTISAVDAAGPAPCSLQVPGLLGTAILDMQTAYTDAAGRTTPDFTELGAGNITGRTLAPGLYKWSTDVLVSGAGVTLSGGPNAVWIFQIAGDVLLSSNAHINLAGGARANNIFWQVGGPTAVTLGTGSVFAGNILSAKQVIMNTGSSLNGRAYAFSQATLQSSPVTNPGPLVGGVPVPLAPTVTSTTPANLSVNVPFGNALSATFSETMDPTSINALTFTLKNGLTAVAGVVAYSGVTATFTPSANLAANTLYTARITTGAKDPAGVPLAADFVWTFTTGTVPDITPPTVSSTVPANGAVAVPVGNALSATFSKSLNPLTVNAATFLVKQGATVVAGSVAYTGVTATFTPTAAFAPSLPFTATITTGVQDLAGNALAANFVWNFTTGATPDITPPTVISTVPISGALAVSVNNTLSVTFSKPLNPLTVNAANFLLKQGATVVPGTLAYAGVTATFTPLAALAPSLPFTATITTGVQDLAGNALAAPFIWTFTTAATPDLTPPTVSATFPANGATGVPVGTAFSATFSKPLNPLTVSTATFLLKQGATAIAGTVTYSGTTATFTPLAALALNTTYTATITTGVQDLAGNALAANYVWSLTTFTPPPPPPPPATLPTVISTMPASGASQVTLTSNVVATFSNFMNPATINSQTFTVTQGGAAVSGSVIYSGTTATFRPLNNLLVGVPYQAIISTGATDVSGNSLAAAYQWAFTTGNGSGQTSVCLSNFALLAGTAVTGTGTNVVTGDIGVSPGSTVTGFPAGSVTGTIHAADAAAAQAIADLNSAYTEAVSRTAAAVPVTADLGGQTLTAGLYNSRTALVIQSGDLTLDAKGDPNAAFVFQSANSLTTSDGRLIVLTGGARAVNVFFQVGSSATLGANTLFNGSILASQSISVGSGATVNGRLLALNGAITLQSDTVTSPLPLIAIGGIVNASDAVTTVAAGSIAAIFGNNLGSSLVAANSYPLPVTLGGGGVRIDGQSAPLFMTSCSQVNLQIPWEVAGKTQVPAIASAGGQVSAQAPVTIAPFAPGIFSLNMRGSGQGAIEIANTTMLAAPQGSLGTPAQRGQYLAIFCTGLGPVSNQPATGVAASSNPLSVTSTLPTVTIGGASAQVTYSGLAPGFAGLYQVNVVVPAGAPSGAGVNVILSIGGVQSNTVTVAVQ